MLQNSKFNYLDGGFNYILTLHTAKPINKKIRRKLNRLAGEIILQQEENRNDPLPENENGEILTRIIN